MNKLIRKSYAMLLLIAMTCTFVGGCGKEKSVRPEVSEVKEETAETPTPGEIVKFEDGDWREYRDTTVDLGITNGTLYFGVRANLNETEASADGEVWTLDASEWTEEYGEYHNVADPSIAFEEDYAYSYGSAMEYLDEFYALAERKEHTVGDYTYVSYTVDDYVSKFYCKDRNYIQMHTETPEADEKLIKMVNEWFDQIDESAVTDWTAFYNGILADNAEVRTSDWHARTMDQNTSKGVYFKFSNEWRPTNPNGFTNGYEHIKTRSNHYPELSEDGTYVEVFIDGGMNLTEYEAKADRCVGYNRDFVVYKIEPYGYSVVIKDLLETPDYDINSDTKFSYGSVVDVRNVKSPEAAIEVLKSIIMYKN